MRLPGLLMWLHTRHAGLYCIMSVQRAALPVYAHPIPE